MNVLYFTLVLAKYVRSAQYDCFRYFLDVVLSRCVALIFSEWFWDGSICPCYYWYITFHIRCVYVVRSLYLKIDFFLDHIFISWNCNICYVRFSLSRIMMSGFLLGMIVTFRLLIHDFFIPILVHAHTSVPCFILPPFPYIW
jgi:hypothetical protein